MSGKAQAGQIGEIAAALGGRDYEFVVLTGSAALTGLAIALLLVAAELRGPVTSGRRGRFLPQSLLLLALPLLLSAATALLWHVGRAVGPIDAGKGPGSGWGMYVLGGIFVVGGYGLWLVRSEFQDGYRDPERRSYSRTRLALVLSGCVLIGIGLGMAAYRYAEGGPTRATTTGAVKTESDAVSVPAAPAGSPGGLGDTLSLMALVLTLLTGIAVQFISTSLAQINQQRREIDMEVDTAKRIDRHHREIEDHKLRMRRLRYYQDFHEARIKQIETANLSGNMNMKSFAELRRIFQYYDPPLSANLPTPKTLVDIYEALGLVAGVEPFRKELSHEHIEVIRNTHRLVIEDPNLPDEARIRFSEIMASFLAKWRS